MWIADQWQDYELLDCGGGEKLERWDKQYLVRPDPQAIWETPRRLPEWKRANARYLRSQTGGGHWEKKALPESWQVHYKDLTFQVKPMNFKHTGLFPEQAVNWDFVMDKIRKADRPIRVLNLFAYTGGTDFIALYVSNKTGKSIWSYVFVFNACILCIFGYLFGWLYAGYSILFQFISTKTVETFHHRYERLTLQITTQKAEEIMAAYVSGCRHGMSCVKAVGGYSHKDMSVLHTVISSYEESDIVHLILQVDPHAIINVLRTENFYGGFYRAPLD